MHGQCSSYFQRQHDVGTPKQERCCLKNNNNKNVKHQHKPKNARSLRSPSQSRLCISGFDENTNKKQPGATSFNTLPRNCGRIFRIASGKSKACRRWLKTHLFFLTFFFPLHLFLFLSLSVSLSPISAKRHTTTKQDYDTWTLTSY